MMPFDTGHIPILCALLRHVLAPPPPQTSIYDEVAATNLSKFSFRTGTGRTTDNMVSFRLCWDWFSKAEIRELRPDYVLCLSGPVFRIVRRGLRAMGHPATPIPVAFPHNLVINARYRDPPAVPAIERKAIVESLNRADRQRMVRRGARGHMTLRQRAEQDWVYFASTNERMLEAVALH